jgi:uncharacterized protein YhfF
MTERPIIFNTPMVQAILDGRKTITRRLVKQSNSATTTNFFKLDFNDVVVDNGYLKVKQREDDTRHRVFPKIEIGDILWVRETWGKYYDPVMPCCNIEHIVYKADNDLKDGKWYPSIHMHRSASRITLEITNIKVERLRDITEEDAIKEGINRGDCSEFNLMGVHRALFSKIWESIYGAESWQFNPWVWVIEFKKI